MPRGYNLNPNVQMKIEDERAGRLDYVYETSLSVEQCQSRIGSTVAGKLSHYETEVKDGILYISFIDSSENTGGLFVSPPQKYAVRFESDADKTIIRVRYVWENDTLNVQYLMREDIDAFFTALFDASVTAFDDRVWTDSTKNFTDSDPLKIHGTKLFWVVAAAFVILWVVVAFLYF